MKNYKPPEDGSVPVNPFLAVMSKEYDGHRRLVSRGVTNKLIKKVNGGETSYMVPRELMESLKANVEAEISQLTDMRKELKEDHERKKAELEAMQKDIDNQRDKLVEDVMQKLIEKLPPVVAREFLT